MARIKLSFPDNAFYFETKMPVRITDINGANHLGNDALISMLSEARAQFLVNYGVEEADKNGGDFVFRVTKAESGQPVALAKYGFVFFNYQRKSVVPMPESFRARFGD
ncbi:thioesterase family protein [Marinobacter salarius]|uniref:thioesterase family protein n=1 Tax=Marinobacter salarius TaxID=1420917 RepID=UPI000F856346|nr:thioesterase family protein [Marinobacter salarius]AZR41301.1 4-hydroxybenzoyl-CoA thioesterase [Marinobacter salarius]